MPSESKEITVAPTVLEQYVGTYELNPKVSMMITLDGSQLVSQLSGQGKVPLFAKSERTFFPKVVDAVLRFEKNAEGKVSTLVLMQAGREMKATRKQ